MALGNPQNYITRKLYHVNSCSATGGMVYANGLGRMIFWGGTSPAAADVPAPGALWMDTTNKKLKYNSGTASSPSWTAAGDAGTQTLDSAFDQGKVINGATSEANAFGVGGATDYFTMWQEGANDIRIGSSSGANMTIVPDGGTVNITGICAVSGNATVGGDLTVSGALSAASISQDAVTASSSGADLTLDGDTTGGVDICSTSSGGITLGDDTTLASGKTLTLTGTAGSTIATVTAGDVVLSDGSVAITDADNAASLSVTNGTLTTSQAVDITLAALTTGSGLRMTADALTTGEMLLLDSDGGPAAAGAYITCYDGSANDFQVKLHGEIEIAGNDTADMITVTKGNLQLDDGVFEVDVDSNQDCYIKRNQATTTVPVLELEASNASDDQVALLIDHNGTGASGAMQIDHEGTADCLTITSLAANASLIKGTAEATTGTVLEAVGAASSTVGLATITNGGTGATGWLGADDVGMLNITNDGNLAHADASCLRIAYSGTGAASGMGTSLRVVDTGATATSYAVYISSATGEALKVDAGKCVFDEQIEISGGFKTTTGAFVLSDSGADSMDIDGGAANDTLNIGSTTATDVMLHGATAGEDFVWDASASQAFIGGTGARAGTVGDSCLSLFDGTAAPAGALANGITLYSEGGECKVLDAAGNSTTLSPHRTIEGKIGTEWTFDSVNHEGKRIHIQMEKLVKKLAEKYPEDFAEFIHEEQVA